MKFFTLISKKGVHLAPGQKRIPKEEFSELISAKELLEKIREEERIHREEITEEGKEHFEAQKKKGFEEGIALWSEQIHFLEKETKKVRGELQKFLVQIAMATAKKIVGRELKQDPSTLVDIVAQNLRQVSSHKKITLYANKKDVALLNEHKDKMKAILDEVQNFVVQPKDDIHEGGVVIETEAGIIDARAEVLWTKLEQALDDLIEKK